MRGPAYDPPVDVEVRSPATDGEVERIAEIFRRSFNAGEEVVARLVERADRSRIVAAFVGGEPVAATRVRPFGVFLGGRRVALGGYSPVAVAAEHRGRGLGRLVSTAPLPSMRERGEGLAGLYPASTRLYRGAGFEVAGTWSERSIVTRQLLTLPPAPEVEVRRATRDDLPAIADCYRRYAPSRHGHLDRPDEWWTEILRDDFADRHVYVVDGEGGSVTAYLRYRHLPAAVDYTIRVDEVVASTAAHTCALWRLVGSSSTQAATTAFAAPPEHPLVLLLPEQDDRPAPMLQTEIRPMMRVVDAPVAVGERGFPDVVTAAVDLDLADPDCPWHEGRWRLVVEGGAGVLERGGTGSVRLGPRGLAPLFTGYAGATALAAAGLVDADRRADLATLDAVFAGPPPFCPDAY
jgi:predicted acetyltransferase